MQKIMPCLWFDGNAQDAVDHYTSIFNNAKVLSSSKMGDIGHGSPGALLTAVMELDGQRVMVLNGGPHFKFSPAISLVINCESQEEVDMYWEKLSEGGTTSQCGWLDDKFGVSWQIVPTLLGKLMQGDQKKANAVMGALMKMTKLESDILQKAYDEA